MTKNTPVGGGPCTVTDKYSKLGDCCRHFLQCDTSSLKWVQIDCPPNTVFDKDQNVCNFCRAVSGCTGGRKLKKRFSFPPN